MSGESFVLPPHAELPFLGELKKRWDASLPLTENNFIELLKASENGKKKTLRCLALHLTQEAHFFYWVQFLLQLNTMVGNRSIKLSHFITTLKALKKEAQTQFEAIKNYYATEPDTKEKRLEIDRYQLFLETVDSHLRLSTQKKNTRQKTPRVPPQTPIHAGEKSPLEAESPTYFEPV